MIDWILYVVGIPIGVGYVFFVFALATGNLTFLRSICPKTRGYKKDANDRWTECS